MLPTHSHSSSLYATLTSVQSKGENSQQGLPVVCTMTSRVYLPPLYIAYKSPAFERSYFQESTVENENLTRSIATAKRPTLQSLGIWVLGILSDAGQKSKLHNFSDFLMEQLARWRWCIWEIAQHPTQGHFYF